MAERQPISARNGEAANLALRHRPRLLNFIRKRVQTDEDAEDILQDVFYQFLSNYSIAQPIEQLSAWLYTVARNRIVDWYRARKHRSRQLTDDETGLPLNLEEILFDPSDEPDRVMHRGAVWEAVADALDDLPEKQGEVFVMHELEGLSFKEIAEITSENINTLLSRKRYAVLALREALRDMYNEL